MYKLTHSYDDYEHPPSKRTTNNDNNSTVVNDYGRPPASSNQFTKSIRSNERSHDIVGSERYQQQQHQQPMMVIRNYGHSRPIRTSTTTASISMAAAPLTAVHSQVVEPRRYSHQSNDNNNVHHHRNGNNANRKPGNHFNQMDSRKNGCCPNANDEIDFRELISIFSSFFTFFSMAIYFAVNHYILFYCSFSFVKTFVFVGKMNSAIRPGFVASVAKMWDQRAVENSNEFNTIV